MIFLSLLMGLVFAESPSPQAGPSPTPTPTPGPTAPAKPSVKKEKTKPSPPRIETTKKKATTSSHIQQAPFLAEEAMNLIVPNQKYLLKFEEEESFGKVQGSAKAPESTKFSNQEVESYEKAVKYVIDYRNNLRHKCLGESSRKIGEALEKYLTSLCQFNRKALPMVADISEDNSSMILVVNQSTLIDAPVLLSRYVQFKKQRFKENMGKFLKDDNKLVSQMTEIAKTFKVEIDDSQWKKNYALRENGLEVISQWPREIIFQATDKLAQAKESACIVNLNPETDQSKLAE